MFRTKLSILSALFALALNITSFILIVVLLAAGNKPGQLEDAFLFKINTTEFGSDLIRFERATSSTSGKPSSTATTPTTTSSSNPLDILNPFSTDSPLNPKKDDNFLNDLPGSLGSFAGNLTDIIDDGLGDAVNKVVEGLVNSTGIRDFYFLYLNRVCEGPFRNDSRGSASETQKCTSYDAVAKELNASSPNIRSSVVLGQTNISVPLIAEAIHSTGSVSSLLTTLRRGILVFLIIAAIGSGAVVILIPASILLQSSRPVVYANIFFSELAAIASFIAALLLTILIKGFVGVLGGVGKALSLVIDKGDTTIALAWISWTFSLLVSLYWVAVWFVAYRRWSFVGRERSDDEIGNWRGIGREIQRDLQGKMK